MTVGAGFEELLDFVMPRKCAVCGRYLSSAEEHICSDCLEDMPYTGHPLIFHNAMANAYNARIASSLEDFEPYQAAVSLIRYEDESPYRNLTRGIKYGRKTSLGVYLGRCLGTRMASGTVFAAPCDSLPAASDAGVAAIGLPDLIVPVPLHWTRQYRRGYNQAEVIARGVAESLGGIAVESHLLVRSRRTASQVGLNTEEKARNVAGAFSLGNRKAVGRCQGARHILLVDDVFTTGSTLYECHQALRKVFAPDVRISVATIAFRIV